MTLCNMITIHSFQVGSRRRSRRAIPPESPGTLRQRRDASPGGTVPQVHPVPTQVDGNLSVADLHSTTRSPGPDGHTLYYRVID